MARARNIKPGLLKNELLGEADPLLTILFIGLWTLADREGRLEDRPKRIKAEVFPYRELPDFNGYLTELERMGFIQRYSANGAAYIQVSNFAKHQSPHKTERASEIPEPPAKSDSCLVTEAAPLKDESPTVKESLIPDSSNTDSLTPDSESTGADAPPSKRFKPPTLDEVTEYVQQRGNRINPNKFVNFYTSNGWKVGKNKMIDWRAAVHSWETREDENSSGTTRQPADTRRLSGAERTRQLREELRQRELANESPDLGCVGAD